uniref:Protein DETOXIFICATION n=1 Tax=Fagus sylvatica TaxID=28930 RepID=A0A2N9G9D1_FAGSY
MASALTLHHLLCLYSPKTNPSSISHSPIRNPNCSVRIRTVPKSSPKKRATTSLENPPLEPKPDSPTNRIDPDPPSFPSPLRRLRDVIKFDELALEILSIALPAALALAADPIASLVDSAFVGHIGSVELAAVGVSVSVFNLVSKLFNVPLLNITTSFVAEEQALISKGAEGSSEMDNDCTAEHEGKKLLPSVSTSLALAASIGIAEAVALSFGSGFLMNIMGIPVDSPMRVPAEQFLTWRAFGAPPIVIALAAQGTFRAGNLLNALLDPILIFLVGLGIGGAAISTVISEYVSNVVNYIMLDVPEILKKRVILLKLSGLLIDIGNSYLAITGGLLIGRTLAVLVTMTLATSMAAREGPIPMAGHQICIQVWLAVSLLTDALALAGQALLASGYSQGNYEQSRQVIYRVLQIGLVSGIALAVILFLGFGAFSSLFTTDLEVLGIAWSGILVAYLVLSGPVKVEFGPTGFEPTVNAIAGSQPMNALAFVLDGLYYGVSDFGYAAYSMVLVGLISSIFLLVAAPVFGLAGVWAGLFLFMTLRVVAGIWRLGTKSGPWKMVWSEVMVNDTLSYRKLKSFKQTFTGASVTRVLRQGVQLREGRMYYWR